MNKPKLNQPDVEQTTTIGIFSNNINKSMGITVDKNGFAIPQTKSPTLEEVKKEWEELGYDIYQERYFIAIKSKTKKMEIIINSKNKYYFKRDDDNFWETITIQEHKLLTKTFKALGWM